MRAGVGERRERWLYFKITLSGTAWRWHKDTVQMKMFIRLHYKSQKEKPYSKGLGEQLPPMAGPLCMLAV